MAEKHSHEFYVDGVGALTKAPFGLTKNKAFIPPLLLSLAVGVLFLTDTPMWLNWLNKNSGLSIEVPFSVFLFVFGIFIGASLWYLRLRTKRSLELKYRLHRIAHKLRNYHGTLCKEGADEKALYSYSKEMVDRIEAFLEALHPNKGVKVAVRLGITSEDDGEVEFNTIARSSNFNESRSNTSEPVPQDKGEAKLLEENSYKGLVVFNDLDYAESQEKLFPTENRKQYRHELESLAVAPMNGWNGKERAMIGMVYFASSFKNAFSEKDADAMLFLADSLASLYIGILHHSPDGIVNKQEAATK